MQWTGSVSSKNNHCGERRRGGLNFQPGLFHCLDYLCGRDKELHLYGHFYTTELSDWDNAFRRLWCSHVEWWYGLWCKLLVNGNDRKEASVYTHTHIWGQFAAAMLSSECAFPSCARFCWRGSSFWRCADEVGGLWLKGASLHLWVHGM